MAAPRSTAGTRRRPRRKAPPPRVAGRTAPDARSGRMDEPGAREATACGGNERANAGTRTMVTSSAVVTAPAPTTSTRPGRPQSTVRQECGEDEQQGAERDGNGRQPDGQVIRCPARYDRHRAQEQVGEREYRERTCQQEFVQPGAAAKPAEYQEAGQQPDDRRRRVQGQVRCLLRVAEVQLRRQRKGRGHRDQHDCGHDNRGVHPPHGPEAGGDRPRQMTIRRFP